jgi:hypothetical protein
MAYKSKAFPTCMMVYKVLTDGDTCDIWDISDTTLGLGAKRDQKRAVPKARLERFSDSREKLPETKSEVSSP